MRISADMASAAVEAAPGDHEMLYGIASGLVALGDDSGARAALVDAAQVYPADPKPHNTLGSQLLGAGRPRAALRRFEQGFACAVEALDDVEGWDATANVALCIVLLAEVEMDAFAAQVPPGAEVATAEAAASRVSESGRVSRWMRRRWRFDSSGRCSHRSRWLQRVPEAKCHVQGCLAGADSTAPPLLLDLLGRCDALLAAAPPELLSVSL